MGFYLGKKGFLYYLYNVIKKNKCHETNYYFRTSRKKNYRNSVF